MFEWRPWTENIGKRRVAILLPRQNDNDLSSYFSSYYLFFLVLVEKRLIKKVALVDNEVEKFIVHFKIRDTDCNMRQELS